ncbi:hypothetical protein AVEN_72509-1 [Araneus ventricosus]|uniref:Uncharacterized protein n=1 Tax=Araneus ventricosus TaxID=182803 RepID=A0A4Y2G8I9_ARAVE|nr:hypothetical protein AVEN_72509-1 [Araneus ventricosus]
MPSAPHSLRHPQFNNRRRAATGYCRPPGLAYSPETNVQVKRKRATHIPLGNGGPGSGSQKDQKNSKTSTQLDHAQYERVFHLKYCTKCQGFGHLVKHCKDVRPT